MQVHSPLDLRALLAPLDPQDFLERYWQREPVVVRGDGDRFRELFSSVAFVRALARQEEVGLSVRASRDHEGDDGLVDAHVEIDPEEVFAQYREGVSICVDPIDRADEVLHRFAQDVRRQLGHLGGVSVKCYLSSDRYGFNRHFDAGVVTSLQIEGAKRWRYSRRPAVEHPANAGFLSADGDVRYIGRLPSSLAPWERAVEVPPADELVEVVLEPGDVLCLPAGTWHEAKAIGGSLALNLSFTPLGAWELVAPLVGGHLRQDASWRQNLPAVPMGGGSGDADAVVAAAVRDHVRELGVLLQRWADDGSLDVERAVRAARDDEAMPPVPVVGLVRMGQQRHDTDDASRGAHDPAASDRPDRGAVTASGVGAAGYDGGLSCTMSVRDVVAAADWYETVLGFDRRAVIAEFGWCELGTPARDVRLGLSEVHEVDAGGALLNFGVVDIDAARAELEARGVEFDGPTRTISGMVRLAAFHDPDGNPLMLYEPLEPHTGRPAPGR